MLFGPKYLVENVQFLVEDVFTLFLSIFVESHSVVANIKIDFYLDLYTILNRI